MDGPFTENHAQNDGLIKREVGPKMAGNAKRNASRLFQMFEKVCREMGREPEEVLGDHMVKALNSEAHAEAIFETEIDLSEVQQDELSMEDAQFVQQMMEALGVGGETEKDPLDRFVEQRLESATSSPLGRVKGRKKRDVDAGVRQELNEMKEQMNALASRFEESTKGGGEETVEVEEKSVDEALGFEEAGGGGDGLEIGAEEDGGDAELVTSEDGVKADG